MLILVGYISDLLEDLVLLDFLNNVGAKKKKKKTSSMKIETLQLTKDRKT